MASMAKLYPPIIANTIPAFYEENGTVKITVPFSMNRAVDKNLISGFSLKVKTAQSNTYILSLDSYDVEGSISSGKIVFTWSQNDSANFINYLKLGLFYKFQIAYRDKNNIVGYFSTVAIGKYTSKPNIYIQGATVEDDLTGIAIFKQSYLGIFEIGEDQSERPYSYNFYLYDQHGLVEESGWLLHNTTMDSAVDERLQLETTADKYTYLTTLKEDTEYYIQYGVRTINNLEVFSPLYPCIQPLPQRHSFDVSLKAENIFEEGYVNLSLEVSTEKLNELNENIGTSGLTLKEMYERFYDQLYNTSHLLSPVSVEICRAEKTDNYQSWILLRRAYFTSYIDALDWTLQDFTIEQGITYKYCIREYNKFGLYTERILSNAVMADFEDMFLYDGKKQLKVRFNPKMSSFKATKLEQKLDTIGNKYPFIFKNGIVDYKEFPISGLISYKADNNELFVNHYDDLNIILGKYPHRRSTPVDLDVPDVDMDNDYVDDEQSWELTETLDSIGYNTRAERRFKLKVLEWLNNSEVKLFRSPTEGSYLVRLMNVSMSPEDRLGRMLHNFSCQAYEVDELNYNNLLAYGFINLNEIERKIAQNVSTFFCDKIPNDISFYSSFKINEGDIYDYFNIQPSPNSQITQIYVRIGSDSSSSKTLIIGQKGLMIKDNNQKLPDIYFNPSDNADLLTSMYNVRPTSTTADLRQGLYSLFGSNPNAAAGQQTGLLVSYRQVTTAISAGDIVDDSTFENDGKIMVIDEVYMSNRAVTIFDNNSSSIQSITQNQSVESGSYVDVMKMFSLVVYKKEILDLEQLIEGTIVDHDTYLEVPQEELDKLSLYNIFSYNGNLYYHSGYEYQFAKVLPEDEANIYKFIYKDQQNNTIIENNLLNMIYFDIPKEYFDLNGIMSVGPGLYFNVVFQIKITKAHELEGA